jgi:hypothetical protein
VKVEAEAQLMKPYNVIAYYLKVMKLIHSGFRGFFSLTDLLKCDNLHNEDPKELKENLG